ncbi:MAG: recombinase family protein, partial [Pseudonocardiaceae bacterium]
MPLARADELAVADEPVVHGAGCGWLSWTATPVTPTALSRDQRLADRPRHWRGGGLPAITTRARSSGALAPAAQCTAPARRGLPAAAGLDAQRATVHAEAERRGLRLVEVFTDEGISGKSTDGRPGPAAALDAVESGRAAVLVVAKLDRLSRSPSSGPKACGSSARRPSRPTWSGTSSPSIGRAPPGRRSRGDSRRTACRPLRAGRAGTRRRCGRSRQGRPSG